RSAKAHHLVLQLVRRERLSELQKILRDERPNVEWPMLQAVTSRWPEVKKGTRAKIQPFISTYYLNMLTARRSDTTQTTILMSFIWAGMGLILTIVAGVIFNLTTSYLELLNLFPAIGPFIRPVGAWFITLVGLLVIWRS